MCRSSSSSHISRQRSHSISTLRHDSSGTPGSINQGASKRGIRSTSSSSFRMGRTRRSRRRTRPILPEATTAGDRRASPIDSSRHTEAGSMSATIAPPRRGIASATSRLGWQPRLLPRGGLLATRRPGRHGPRQTRVGGGTARGRCGAAVRGTAVSGARRAGDARGQRASLICADAFACEGSLARATTVFVAF